MSLEERVAGLCATVEARMKSIDERLIEHGGLFSKLFDRQDEIKDELRKFNGKIEEARQDCDKRCTATEREVSVWRRVTYFVVFVVLVGGIALSWIQLAWR